MKRRRTGLATALAAAVVLTGATTAGAAPAPTAPGTFYFENGAVIEDAYDVFRDGRALFCDIDTGSAASREDGADALVTVDGNVWTVLDEFGERSFAFGRASDVPLCGNFDGQPGDEVAVRRGDNQYIVASRNVTGGGAVTSFRFGRAIDLTLVGDWDGDGVDTLAVRSLAGNRYYFAGANTEGGGRVVSSLYGSANMVPAAGDYYGQGFDSLVVQQSFADTASQRPLRTPVLHLSSSRPGGVVRAQDSVGFGRFGDVLVSADIDGDGADEAGVLRVS